MNKDTLEITIEQKHIELGIPKVSYSCPIALVLEDVGCTNVHVDVSCMEFIYGGRNYYIKTPQTLRDFMDNFDNETLWNHFHTN